MATQNAMLGAARLTASAWTGIIRFASGAVASVIFLATLLNYSPALSLNAALVITAAWSLAACLVVTWPPRVSGRMLDASGTPSWDHVLWTSLIVVAIVGMTLVPPRELAGVFDALALALGVTYIGAKAGCCLRGCCNWATTFQVRSPITRVSLPALELIITAVLSSALLLFLGVVTPGRIFGAFLLTHVGSRAVARHLRGTRPRFRILAAGGLLATLFFS